MGIAIEVTDRPMLLVTDMPNDSSGSGPICCCLWCKRSPCYLLRHNSSGNLAKYPQPRFFLRTLEIASMARPTRSSCARDRHQYSISLDCHSASAPVHRVAARGLHPGENNRDLESVLRARGSRCRATRLV